MRFEIFYKWAIANRYSGSLSIDRINNNGNYEPNNCRWVTPKMQARNTRNNRLITFNGITEPCTVWDERMGLPVNRTANRLGKGWSIERALTQVPILRNHK
jgi:hypothetical protein